MKRAIMAYAAAGVLAVLAGSLPAQAQAIGSDAAAAGVGQSSSRLHMREFAETRAPSGYVQFCRDFPRDCRLQAASAANGAPVALTPARWRQLSQINDRVNREVRPVTDQDLYGRLENWTYPEAGAGDCEDYVLLKRRMLLDQGWPAEALLITVVRDEADEGHAVLTVATDAGDFVLDNRIDPIMRWQDAPYSYRKRQSVADPRMWVSLSYEASPRRTSSAADPVGVR